MIPMVPLISPLGKQTETAATTTKQKANAAVATKSKSEASLLLSFSAGGIISLCLIARVTVEVHPQLADERDGHLPPAEARRQMAASPSVLFLIGQGGGLCAAGIGDSDTKMRRDSHVNICVSDLC